MIPLFLFRWLLQIPLLNRRNGHRVSLYHAWWRDFSLRKACRPQRASIYSQRHTLPFRLCPSVAGMARGHLVYGRRTRAVQKGHPEDDSVDSGVFAKRRSPRCLWSWGLTATVCFSGRMKGNPYTSMWQREIPPQASQRFGLPAQAIATCAAILYGYRKGRFATSCGCWNRIKKKLLKSIGSSSLAVIRLLFLYKVRVWSVASLSPFWL